jgi:hypothetical protein
MRTSVKLLLGGIFITVSFLLAGCTGTTHTTYYRGYYDPYPYYYRSHRTVYYHRPPSHRPPNIGRPVQLPSRPTARPTPRPMPRQRR